MEHFFIPNPSGFDITGEITGGLPLNLEMMGMETLPPQTNHSVIYNTQKYHTYGSIVTMNELSLVRLKLNQCRKYQIPTI